LVLLASNQEINLITMQNSNEPIKLQLLKLKLLYKVQAFKLPRD